MAMYKQRGYCPNDDFIHYGEVEGKNVSSLWYRTSEILGDRCHYMVYENNCYSYKDGCYIIDAIEGATATLGIEVACALRHLMPVCVHGKTDKPICCHDLINPLQIPAKLSYINEKWELGVEEDRAKMVLIQDERFLVVMQDKESEINIYLYKK